MKISVVIATYNGEKYIFDQLNSINQQVLPVDEVIIVDDRSKDNTVAICQQFIDGHKLQNWKIVVNDLNLGYYGNFFKGFRLSSGEIIFLCDQDDIWRADKTKEMVNIFETHAEVLSLTSTFSLFTNDGKIIKEHMKHPYRVSNGLCKISLSQFIKFHSYLGMTMAIRKDLLQYVSTQNPNNITHDILLNMYAAFNDGLYHLDKVLTNRRHYSASVSNSIMSVELRDRYNGNPQLQKIDRGKRYTQFDQYNITNEFAEKTMTKFHSNFIRRESYFKNNSILGWMGNIRNLPYYESLRSYIKDGIYLMKSARKSG